MYRKLVSGALSGVAALALAVVGGTTHSSPEGSADVSPNVLRGGVLLLSLGAGGGAATLSFDDVLPGGTGRQLIFAENETASSVPATLAITFTDLRDRAATCSGSVGKAEGEIASGIGGCSVAGGVSSGTPAQGNLSRLLAFDVSYAPSSSTCTVSPGANSLLPDAGRGNLRTSALAHRGAGSTYRLTASGGRSDLVLQPGKGVCVAVTARWPEDASAAQPASPERPVDNAAQDDSFTVGVRFDLTQVPR